MSLYDDLKKLYDGLSLDAEYPELEEFANNVGELLEEYRQ